jgi:hypothetical protein
MNYADYSNGIMRIGFHVYFTINRGIGGAYPGLMDILIAETPDGFNTAFAVDFNNCNINTKAYSKTMYLVVGFDGYYDGV